MMEISSSAEFTAKLDQPVSRIRDTTCSPVPRITIMTRDSLRDLAAGETHLGLPGQPVLSQAGTSARALKPGLLAVRFPHWRLDLLVATDNMYANFVRLPWDSRKRTCLL